MTPETWALLAVIVWVLCGIAIGLLIGRALRGIDEESEPEKDLTPDWQWPTFTATRIPPRFPADGTRHLEVVPERRVRR